jgi:hypothetical protein
VVTKLSVFPNPVGETFTARYLLTKPVKVNLGLYDATGSLVAVLLEQKQEAGTYTLPIEKSYLKTAGVYFLKLRMGDKTETVTLIR